MTSNLAALSLEKLTSCRLKKRKFTGERRKLRPLLRFCFVCLVTSHAVRSLDSGESRFETKKGPEKFLPRGRA